MGELGESHIPKEGLSHIPEAGRGRKITREEFGAEVEANYNIFLRHAKKMLHFSPSEQDAAQTIVQDVCLDAYRNLENFHGAASLKTYIMVSIRNRVIDRYRRSATERKHLGQRQMAHESGEGDFDFLDSLPSADPTALDELQRQDLQKAIERLPENLRAASEMEITAPKGTTKEKASALGISVPAYKSRMMRVRAELRKKGYGN